MVTLWNTNQNKSGSLILINQILKAKNEKRKRKKGKKKLYLSKQKYHESEYITLIFKKLF